jgi:hypothetical protein
MPSDPRPVDPADADRDPAEEGRVPPALAPLPARQVEVFGDQVLAVRLPDGSIWLSLRMLCDNFGVARARQAQRIRENDTLAEDLIDVRVETAGGPQTMQVLRLERVPYWISDIQINRVREDLREKLRQYKRWVVQKVYEAFMQEWAGDAPLAVGDAPSETMRTLIQVRDMHRAMAAFAEAQMALQAQVEQVDTRMDRAALVVRELQQRVRRLEQQLNPGEVILDEQAAAIQNAVKALAVFLTSQDPSKNHFQGIWTEIGRRFRVPEYRRLRQAQYPEVLALLEEWLQAAVAAGESPARPALPSESAPPTE